MSKKQTAFNTHLLIGIFLFMAFLALSILSAVSNEIGLAIAFAVFTVVPIADFVLSPICYVFSADEVVIVYTLGKREVIKWSAVRSIYKEGSWIGKGMPCYVFSYPVKEKRAFFMRGEISITKKTKMLVTKYWKKDIKN